jgi:hypothetical protein
MQYFWDWAVLPLLRDRGVKQVLEIGASQGGNTVRILRGLAGVRVTVVDPCLDADLVARFKDEPAVTVWGGRSLEVLPFLQGPYDAILIDGDHNYYTVCNELRLIADRGMLSPGGIILFHDVGEPYARRDFYYEPERIPDQAKAADKPHGVLTAIEKFREESPHHWIWLEWGAEHGLGCLCDPRSRWDRYALWAKTCYWRNIRWRNRLLRLTGLKQPDRITWGKQRPPM